MGARLVGPAVVEESESTTVLPPGALAEVDRWASLIVEMIEMNDPRTTA